MSLEQRWPCQSFLLYATMIIRAIQRTNYTANRIAIACLPAHLQRLGFMNTDIHLGPIHGKTFLPVAL
eukprot:scaffold533251_cov33-Prasinocladus_malaysianus.AAC.1